MDINDVHADLTPPYTFKYIFESWLAHKGIKITGITYKDLNNSEKRVFVDEKLTNDWCEFHKLKFKPQPAHSRCNMDQG
ncbi:hypothetical protein PNI02_35240 [Pseudoalteromonas nigrifaciens]|nr:hypothetical protein PNI02_35240 [Pseudoalteromonas nigrifaciens]SUC51654.1 Uncharacterised protein [Pseudoalteromonas nigrifaciens]